MMGERHRAPGRHGRSNVGTIECTVLAVSCHVFMVGAVLIATGEHSAAAEGAESNQGDRLRFQLL